MSRFSRAVAPGRRGWRDLRRRARRIHGRFYGPVWPLMLIAAIVVVGGLAHVVARWVIPGWEWVATGTVVVLCLLFLRQPRGTPPKDWGK